MNQIKEAKEDKFKEGRGSKRKGIKKEKIRVSKSSKILWGKFKEKKDKNIYKEAAFK